MAPSPLVSATLQTAALSALANVLAQILTAYKTDSEIIINWIPVIQFLIFNIVSTPPNFLWQDFLESTFPAYPDPAPSTNTNVKSPPPPPPKLSIRNTAIKMFLDQTLGAAVNTLLFSTFTRSLRGAMAHVPVMTNLIKALHYTTTPGAVDFTQVDFSAVLDESLAEFWGILEAGWKVWPAVSLFNFTMVKTVEGRNLVGSLAGVGWGIYMSLVAAR